MSIVAACCSALQHPDIVAVDPCTVGKLLLRQLLGLPQSTQIPGNDRPHSHAGEVTGSLIYCHLVY